jgi:hypothetical protein
LKINSGFQVEAYSSQQTIGNRETIPESVAGRRGESIMKKVVLLVAFLVSIIAVPSVMAREANRDVLRSQWNAQQVKDQQDLSRLRAIESEASAAVSGFQGKPRSNPAHHGTGSAMH